MLILNRYFVLFLGDIGRHDDMSCKYIVTCNFPSYFKLKISESEGEVVIIRMHFYTCLD